MSLRKIDNRRLRKRRSKNVLKLAFSLAIAAGTTQVAHAQSLPPLPSIEVGGTAAIPQSPASAVSTSNAKRTQVPSLEAFPSGKGSRTSQKLVGLLGLAPAGQHQQSQENCASTVTSCEVTLAREAALPKLPSQVIPAAATEATTTRLTDSSSSRVKRSDGSNAAGDLSLTIGANQPLGASLTNIQIPLNLPTDFPAEPSRVPNARDSEALRPGIPTGENTGAKDSSTRQQPQVVDRRKPIQINSQPEDRNTLSVRNIPVRRSEQVTNSSAKIETTPQDSPALEFSLNDKSDFAVPPDSGNGNNESAAPKRTKPEQMAETASKPAGGLVTLKRMRVQIEGEPTSVTPSNGQLTEKSSRRPRKATAPSPQNVAVSDSTQLEFRNPTVQPPTPVRATLAGHQTQTSTAPPQLTMPPAVTGSELSVALQDSISLRVDSIVVQTSVEDPTVCRVLKAGNQLVSLIGMKPGTTRVAIVKASSDGQRQVEMHTIRVGEAARADAGLTELAHGINETVSRLFVQSEVQVRTHDGGLIVQGRTDSETEAKRILALVRKTSLLPVTDRLQVR